MPIAPLPTVAGATSSRRTDCPERSCPRTRASGPELHERYSQSGESPGPGPQGQPPSRRAEAPRPPRPPTAWAREQSRLAQAAGEDDRRVSDSEHTVHLLAFPVPFRLGDRGRPTGCPQPASPPARCCQPLAGESLASNRVPASRRHRGRTSVRVSLSASRGQPKKDFPSRRRKATGVSRRKYAAWYRLRVW